MAVLTGCDAADRATQQVQENSGPNEQLKQDESDREQRTITEEFGIPVSFGETFRLYEDSKGLARVVCIRERPSLEVISRRDDHHTNRANTGYAIELSRDHSDLCPLG